MRSDRYSDEKKPETVHAEGSAEKTASVAAESAAAETETMPEKKTRRKGRRIVAVILLLLLAACGAAGYYVYTAEHFPKGVTINGVPVGGLTAADAKSALDDGLNQITVTADDGRSADVRTSFKFDCASDIRKQLKIACADPRNYIGMTQDYPMGVTVKDGVKETAAALEEALPDPEGTVYVKNASLDYEEMAIIPEEPGENTDYEKLAAAIAAQREAEPAKNEFSYTRKDFIAQPAVTSADLAEELKFAKYYLADGLKLEAPDGSYWYVTPAELATVILYSENGPKYSEQGANKIAQRIAEDYVRNTRTVRTAEGDRTLLDYVIQDTVDVDKTAESIYKAAKQGKTGTIYIDEASARDLSTRAEVSISTQTVYYFENGELLLQSSCVTGSNATPTPRGIFELQSRDLDVTLTGPNADGTEYRSKVSYWMPFNGGIGFHDATWRSSFGGTIYINGGSHGCVNMPYDKAEQLFNLISVGTLVFVYD